MWNRRDNEGPSAGPATSSYNPTPTSSSPPSAVPTGPAAPRATVSGRAVIGKTIHIRGELTGSEDLLLEGQVEGKIDLKQHGLTIGPNARIQAEVHANTVIVQGNVKGDITADEKVELTEQSKVRGDLTAPRIVIADGAHFKGTVNMGDRPAASAKPTASSKSEQQQGERKDPQARKISAA